MSRLLTIAAIRIVVFVIYLACLRAGGWWALLPFAIETAMHECMSQAFDRLLRRVKQPFCEKCGRCAFCRPCGSRAEEPRT